MLLPVKSWRGVMLGLILILAVCGAAVDWRYLQKGGKEPSKSDWNFLLIALGLVVALFALLAYLGGSEYGLVKAGIEVFVMLFGLWELGRWRVRRKNPLNSVS
jgi:drug/metabolite transporter (DMT)-like permease